MKENIHIPQSWDEAKENFKSHTTRRQRAAMVISGLIMGGAAVVGLQHAAAESTHDQQIENRFSDPDIGARIQNGELDPNSYVPVTVMEGDTAPGIADRFASPRIDMRDLQSELFKQAGEDGLQPGEILYMPVEQVDPTFLSDSRN